MDKNTDKKIVVYYGEIGAAKALSHDLVPLFCDDTVIVCIGTDRCIPDCVGPLVGDYLKESSFPFKVYGTTENPVHALNVGTRLKDIQKERPGCRIIAVDAAIKSGNDNIIGDIILKFRPLRPGVGVGKNLPAVGEVSVVGIVHDSNENFMNSSTRLSLVINVSKVISEAFISAADEYLMINNYVI